MTADPDMLGSVGEEVFDPVTETGSQSQCRQFVGQLVWIDGVEGGTVISEQRPHVTIGLQSSRAWGRPGSTDVPT